MHPFVTGTAATVASTPFCAVHRGARVTRVVDHEAAAVGGRQRPRAFEVEVEGQEGGIFLADAVVVAGKTRAAAGRSAPSHHTLQFP